MGSSTASDCVWGPALSETIDSCLTKHLEQLKAPDGTLLEALGNLHLNSSPDESAVTPGAIPGETLVPGTCRWKCVCYGIGNFATCVIARYQLTFLLLFLEKCRVNFRILFSHSLPWSCTRYARDLWVDRTHSSLLQIPRRHCWVYDPLFSQLEIGVLNSLGLTVLSENEVSGSEKGNMGAVTLLTQWDPRLCPMDALTLQSLSLPPTAHLPSRSLSYGTPQ